jgi:hypothetical protein
LRAHWLPLLRAYLGPNCFFCWVIESGQCLPEINLLPRSANGAFPLSEEKGKIPPIVGEKANKDRAPVAPILYKRPLSYRLGDRRCFYGPFFLVWP